MDFSSGKLRCKIIDEMWRKKCMWNLSSNELREYVNKECQTASATIFLAYWYGYFISRDFWGIPIRKEN